MKRMVFFAAALVAAFSCSAYAQPVSGRYNVTQPTYSDGQQGPLQLDQNGNLKVTGSTGGGGGGGAVYGPNAVGAAPNQPPLLNGFQDASGNVAIVKPATPFPASTPDVRANSQTLSAALNSTLDIPLNGAGTVGLSFSGLTASGATVSFQVSNSGASGPFAAIAAFNAALGQPQVTLNADGDTRVGVSGHTVLRIIVTTGGTGSITVNSNISASAGIVANRAPVVMATGTGGVSAATVGTTASVVSAAVTRYSRLSVQVQSATAKVACALGATPVIGAAGTYSVGNAPGVFNFADDHYVPGDQLQCISDTASTAVTVWSK